MPAWAVMLFCPPSPSIGGSIPIVFSYFSEFLAQEKRGEHLSWLCMFWMIGGIYASAMAWAIIPHYGKSLLLLEHAASVVGLSTTTMSCPISIGWSFQMGSAYQFHSWRVFVLVCAFPAVFAIGALTTMPESPRFFLEVSGPGGCRAVSCWGGGDGVVGASRDPERVVGWWEAGQGP